MHVSGLFKEGRNISILGSVVNLIVSIVLGKAWGIIGIFLGTFCTYLIQIVMKIYYVYKLKFKSSCWAYAFRMIMYSGLFVACMFGCKILTDWCNIGNSIESEIGRDILQFVVNGVVSTVVVILVTLVCFSRTEEFRYYIGLIGGYLKKIKKK